MDIKRKLEQWMKKARIHEHAWLDPKRILFAQEVRDACAANYCGNYGRCWTCPPEVGEWQAFRDHYQQYEHALVYTTLHDLEDSFDIEGMEQGRILHDQMDQALMQELGYGNYELLGAGGCKICAQCTCPDMPCRFPDRARRSMEATGIHVVKLAQDAGIHYINGINTVTYFSIVFWS